MLLKQMVMNIIALQYVCITMDIVSKKTTASSITIAILLVVVLVLILLLLETEMVIDCLRNTPQ